MPANLQYYPTFGSAIQSRSYASGAYRYGFNGKELDKDEEGMGGGGSTYDYGFRIYNPQLGRFLSTDPLFASYPWYTPYQFAGNMPIIAIDLDGLEAAPINDNTTISDPSYIHNLAAVVVTAKRIPLTSTQKAKAFFGSFALSAVFSAAISYAVVAGAAVLAAATAPVWGTVVLVAAAAVGVYMIAKATTELVTGKKNWGTGNKMTEEEKWAEGGSLAGGFVGGYLGAKLGIKVKAKINSKNAKPKVEETNKTDVVNEKIIDAAKQKRAAKYNEYSPNWSEGSFKSALEKFTPDTEGVLSADGVKTRYYNEKTGIELIYDNEHSYFRIKDTKTGQFLQQDGKIPSGGKQGLEGEAASNYESQQTHIKNTD